MSYLLLQGIAGLQSESRKRCCDARAALGCQPTAPRARSPESLAGIQNFVPTRSQDSFTPHIGLSIQSTGDTRSIRAKLCARFCCHHLKVKGNYRSMCLNSTPQADNPATPPSGYTRGLSGERDVSVTSCVLAFLWAGAFVSRTSVRVASTCLQDQIKDLHSSYPSRHTVNPVASVTPCVPTSPLILLFLRAS